MSLENDFASHTSVPARSVTFERRLRLLEAILPEFQQAVTQQCLTIRKSSPARPFWIGLLTPCVAIECEGWRYDRLDNRHDGLVLRLLERFEQTVYLETSAVSEEFESSPFPRLETFRKWINRRQAEEKDLLVGRVQQPTSPEVCSDLLRLLNQIFKAMEDDRIQNLPDEPTTDTNSRPMLVPVLNGLLSTIAKYLNECCANHHTAILLLFSHRLLRTAASRSFTMLFSQTQSANHWQETIVTIEDSSPGRVRPVTSDSNDSQSPRSRMLGPDLCEFITRNAQARLSLQLDQDLLFQLAETDGERKTAEVWEPITLAKGLFENQTELNMKGKVCLAVVLSYSLLDFCGEPWFPVGWTKDGIHFLQSAAQLKLRPTLMTSIPVTTKKLEQLAVPKEIKLLWHGIVLMEVFQQEPLPIDLNAAKYTDVKVLRSAVREQFDAMSWDVCEWSRQAVKICIEGDLGDNLLPGASENPEASFAQAFCQRVLGPLEKDFFSLWGTRDPDEELSRLKLPSVKRKKPLPAPKPVQFKTCLRKRPQPRGPKPLVPIFEALKFFHVVGNPDARQIQGANDWFNLFDQDHIKDQLPKRAKDKQNRIKIAVLDTGINMRNPWIQQKQGRIQCWSPNDFCEETDPHGTQVAYLLLRLAPFTQLRIAKVTSSLKLQDADIDTIAKAITHFSSYEGDRVDIINLSFGFPNFHERLRPILNAIRAARDNNVLIFAAAGNEGGNQGIFWPAKLDDVICINATDSLGNASGFNPTTSGDRLCTLGEAVPTCETDSQQKTIYRSGTSFATPIAVAIAAIVLAYMDSVDAKDGPADFDNLKRKLRTRSGMETVLRNTCVLHDQKRRAGYSYITPWFFLDIEQRSRVHVIANELRGTPE